MAGRSDAIHLVSVLAISLWSLCWTAGAEDAGSLTALTYNTAILGSETVLSRTIDLFKNGSVADMGDVVCLQEVQEVNEITAIVEAAQLGGFPYSLSFLDTFDVTRTAILKAQTPCDPTRLIELGSCLSTNCLTDLNNSNFRVGLHCVFTMCGSQTLRAGLSQECISCIFNQQARGIFGNATCVTPRPGGLSKLDFRPTYGLLMLSKYPLRNSLSKTFQPGASFFSRGYLRATVAGGRTLGDWTAVCTHLYPNTIGLPYVGSRGSASNENLENTLAILNDTEVRNSDRVLLMGDMNHSPNEVEFNDSYNAVLNDSYCSPYATIVNKCTFCTDNPYTNTTKSFIYDHVYVRAKSFIRCSENGSLVADTNSTTFQARRWVTGFSDHYGVVVEINDIPPPSPGSGGNTLHVSSLTLCIALLLAHYCNGVYHK